MPELMVDMLEAPEWVEELFDTLNVFNLKVIEELLKYDVDGFIFGDDWGHQQGLLFSLDVWRRFVKPRLAVLIEAVKGADKAAFVHSCGKVQGLFPELIEIGLDVLNPVQPASMDPARLKKEFGQKLCFWGSIDEQHTLPFGSPEDVRAEVLTRLQTIGENGGLIIGPTHHVQLDTPMENFWAMVDTVTQTKYADL
jgi:uroporphyrinogen-III decarboxylase